MVYVQQLYPLSNVYADIFLALTPILVLFILLMLFKKSAWLSAAIAGIATAIIGLSIWHADLTDLGYEFLVGAFDGELYVAWIAFWGLVFFNTLVYTGKFNMFEYWVVRNATDDIRIQAFLIGWTFNALWEGLVGFGFPWAIVTPILVALGYEESKAIKVAALANTTPTNYGGLGTPILILAEVTGLPLLAVSAAAAKFLTILSMVPILTVIYLVDGFRGIKDIWPLIVVGYVSFAIPFYMVAAYVGPFLPDVIASLVSFGVCLLFLRYWKPRNIVRAPTKSNNIETILGNKTVSKSQIGKGVLQTWIAFFLMIIIVTAWTGPWSPLGTYKMFVIGLKAYAQIYHKIEQYTMVFNPFAPGTAIMVSWLATLPILGAGFSTIVKSIKTAIRQYWGGILTAFFAVGMAFDFNYVGMPYTLAVNTKFLGALAYLLVSPLLGWIGCALTGSDTVSNTLFGLFQLAVARILHFPIYLTVALNSAGAATGKPVSPTTLAAGTATSSFARREGIVARANLPWTILFVFILAIIGILMYLFAPYLFM